MRAIVLCLLSFAGLVGCIQNPQPSPAPAQTSTAVAPDTSAATPEGIKPFLCLPFEEGTAFTITEGWLYSDEESAIHGYKTHYGIDFAAERGTPILAPADGLALSSYHASWLSHEYQGKRVGFGLGRFVQIWHHPEAQLYTLCAHLERIAEGIPYYEPVKKGDGWNPVIVNQSLEKVLEHCKPVKRGQVIGYVGDTGLAWGYDETPTVRPDPRQHPSWDEPHVHLECFRRNAQGIKDERFDPFDLYAKADAYRAVPIRGFWLPGKNNQPQYAK